MTANVPDPDDKYPYREGVLILSAMIVSGIVTLAVSLWVLRDADLINVSVREVRTEENSRGARLPDQPVPTRTNRE